MGKLIKGINDLNTLFPSIAKEWDIDLNGEVTPFDVTPASHMQVWWKCNNGHTYKARIANRTYNNRGCPYCNKKIVIKGKNDLATLYPILAQEWDYEKNSPLTPSDVFAHSGKKHFWKCQICSYGWAATIADRARGTGCPVCSKAGTSFPEQAVYYYIKKHFKDAISRDKSLGFEVDILIPSVFTAIEYDGLYYHSKERIVIKDNEKDELCQSMGVRFIRIRDESLCKTKYAETIFINENDKSSLNKAIAMLFALLQIDPICRIDVEHDYYDIKALTLKERESESIINTMPELAAEWHSTKNQPISIRTVTPGMALKAWWKCSKCGHEWQAYVYSRSAGNGCPKCRLEIIAKKHSLAAAKKNGLLDLHPEIASEWDYKKNDADITSISSGSTKKYWWICPNGHSYLAAVNHRVNGTGCPECGKEKTKKAVSRSVINLDTGEIFDSLDSAGKSCGGLKSGIFRGCQNSNKKVYGYHWAYVDNKTRNRQSKYRCRVRNSDTGEVFDSFSQAAKVYGCTRSSIAKACYGKTKTSQGFHWELLNGSECDDR
ncbi:MAG: hypothetical protein J5756_02340 [Clostridia bacterium]|nr:hypothetical protein [Clostridia bacterium]